MKTVIIGNSGSGKSWLAEKLAGELPIIHLDDLFWEPGGFNVKRSESAIRELTDEALQSESWIAEGVFGDLAEPFIEQADRLNWLDLPWEICRERIVNRFSSSSIHMEREQSKENIAALLKWAEEYYQRDGLRSWRGHGELVKRFTGEKLVLKSEHNVHNIMRSL